MRLHVINIVGGPQFDSIPTTTLKIGPRGMMFNAIKYLSVLLITNLVLMWNSTTHSPTKINKYEIIINLFVGTFQHVGNLVEVLSLNQIQA